MKKVSEYINITYHYDSREERDEHVKQMESEGWECSGQVREYLSLHSDDFAWCGKFIKAYV